MHISISLRRIAAGLFLLAAGTDLSFAQTPACDRWRAEFASLRGGGGGQSASAVRRVGAELSRAINYSRQLGCDRGGFFGGAPPECGNLNARINQLQGQFSQLQAQSQYDGSGQRRAELAGLIENNCQPRGVYQTPPPASVGLPPQQAPRRERSFFEALFGIEPDRPQPGQPQIESTLPELDPSKPAEEKPSIRFGASMPVCVRTCDGYFFPLANSPGGRESQAEMCAALCPSAEMQVFYMSGNGEIDTAVSRNGQGYNALANAGKYMRSYDPSCGCRKQGESWTQALRNAEGMLETRRGDVIVTAAKAEELSRPRAMAISRRQKPAATPTVTEPAIPAEAIPTAGTESAGIGPRDAGAGAILRQGIGLRRDITSATGEKKSVRIVAPNLSPQHNIQ